MLFFASQKMADLSLGGRGPFTIFAPDEAAFGKVSREVRRDRAGQRVSERAKARGGECTDLCRPVFPPQLQSILSLTYRQPSASLVNIISYHVVSCHALLASDLTTPRNLTTLMGDVLHVSSVKVSR